MPQSEQTGKPAAEPQVDVKPGGRDIQTPV